MSTPRPNPITLFTERDKVAPRGQVIFESGVARSQRLRQPPYPFYWGKHKKIELVLKFERVNGAPTAWSFRPRLRIGTGHTSGYQFTNPSYRELTLEETRERCVGGRWFPDFEVAPAIPASGDTPAVPAKTVALPGIWSVIIDNPSAYMQVDAGESGPNALTFTGGTNPNLQYSLIAYPRS